MKYDILNNDFLYRKIIEVQKINKELTINFLQRHIDKRNDIKKDLIFIDGTKCDFYKRNEIELDLLNKLINEIKGEL